MTKKLPNDFNQESKEDMILAELEEEQYLGFFSRFAAAMVDLIFIFLLIIPLFGIIFGNNYIGKLDDYLPPEAIDIITNAQQGKIITEDEQMFLQENVMKSGFIQKVLMLYFLQFIFIGFIIVALWTKFYSTPGKMIFSAGILDATTLRPITFKQSIIRYVAYLASVLPLAFGFMWISFDKKRQGFHDKIANTIVVKKFSDIRRD